MTMMDVYDDADDEDLGILPKPAKVRTIKLHRRNGYFGFGLRGGRERKAGFVVSRIVPGSESELQGLSVGDQVIRIDGMPVAEAIHQEMINFIRSKTRITLSIRRGNAIPIVECTNKALSWQAKDNEHPYLTSSSSWNSNDTATAPVASFVASLTLYSDSKGRFGCSVCEGPPHKKGIYVQSTDEGSVARAAGIKTGDRILHCNGMDVTAIDFDEAVRMLKESTVLNLIISRGAGNDFISPGESSGYNSATSSINGDQSPALRNGKLKRLSVVREEIMDIIDERRGLVVGSVLLDCRNSTWNDTENDGWNDKHHHRGPMPETLNMDVRMNHADRVRLLQDEEEQERELQEKRWWLEEAQRRLTEEKEKLARDRQQLEEAKVELMNETISSKELATVPTSQQVEGFPVKVATSNPIQQQHEQLMEEFKMKMECMKLADIKAQTGKVKIPPLGGIKNHRTHIHAPLRASHSAPPAPPLPPPLPPSSSSSGFVRSKKQAPAPPVAPPDARKMEEKDSMMSEVVLRDKSSKPAVRVSVGTYHSQPEPTRLDFLSAGRNSRSSVGSNASGSSDTIKHQLQTELNETLSRARLRQRLPSQDLPENHNSEAASIKSPHNTIPGVPVSTSSSLDNNQNSKQQPVQVNLKKVNLFEGQPTNQAASNKNPGPGKEPTGAPSTIVRQHRQPSVEIRAKIASLTAAGANAPDTVATEQFPSPPVDNSNRDIRVSADNKVTIRVNPYVTISSYADSRGSSSQRATDPASPQHLGQTQYIDSVPITEL